MDLICLETVRYGFWDLAFTASTLKKSTTATFITNFYIMTVAYFYKVFSYQVVSTDIAIRHYCWINLEQKYKYGEYGIVLGCCGMQSGRERDMFQKSLLTLLPEMLVSIHHNTQCNIQEDNHLHNCHSKLSWSFRVQTNYGQTPLYIAILALHPWKPQNRNSLCNFKGNPPVKCHPC
jgi:hypothetical protein